MNQNKFYESLPISRTLNELFHRKEAHLAKALNEKKDEKLEDAGMKLRAFLGRPNRNYSLEIGTHPDFAHLKIGQTARGHVTSVFVDIKSSTKLEFQHPAETVRRIKQALIESAIVMFQAFDGHVHRLQGDAVFAFFRRKDLTDATTGLDALNAATTLMALLESSINPMLEVEGLDPIKVRIGMDHDPDALWGPYGVRNCTENTATGPYVSLAAKLQGVAGANQIMIGDNLSKLLDVPEEFRTVKTYVKDGAVKSDRYIYPENSYRMWNFEWKRYGEECDWLYEQDKILFIGEKPVNHWVPVKATLLDSNGNELRELKSSAIIVPKGYKIRFSLLKDLMPHEVTSIRWFVENRGEEAAEEDALSYEVEDSRGKYCAVRDTAYLGHHYMTCKVQYRHAGMKERRIGVWIAPSGVNELPAPAPRPQLAHQGFGTLQFQ